MASTKTTHFNRCCRTRQTQAFRAPRCATLWTDSVADCRVGRWNAPGGGRLSPGFATRYKLRCHHCNPPPKMSRGAGVAGRRRCPHRSKPARAQTPPEPSDALPRTNCPLIAPVGWCTTAVQQSTQVEQISTDTGSNRPRAWLASGRAFGQPLDKWHRYLDLSQIYPTAAWTCRSYGKPSWPGRSLRLRPQA